MKITVAIPVGPYPSNQRWLGECLDSVEAQTERPDEILLIDDMAGLDTRKPLLIDGKFHSGINIWRAQWRLGVGTAFNMGVAVARNDCVFMLGSDDRMLPTCLAECRKAYEREKEADGYYYVGVRYLDDREDQNVPCNEAMVTKGLWRETGGFWPESSVGACDAALISTMMIHMPDKIIRVGENPLVEYRPHADTDTAGRGAWQGPILAVRDLLTTQWKKPEWGRMP